MNDATAIYLYLLPKGLVKLKPILDAIVDQRKAQGRPLRVVAYTFQIHGWTASQVDTSTKSGVPVYLYEFGGNNSLVESS